MLDYVQMLYGKHFLIPLQAITLLKRNNERVKQITRENNNELFSYES